MHDFGMKISDTESPCIR